jgi:ecdysteroid kinase
MNGTFKKSILNVTGAHSLYEIAEVQTLWSGYGKIIRYGLKGSVMPSVIVKQIRLAGTGKHPRGWNSDLSHQRKLKSYQVELAWYQQWSQKCNVSCRVPTCLAVEQQEDELIIILEDLNTVGFAERRNRVSANELHACLRWLANFHATFIGEQPKGLWETGTYWHLHTRPDELAALDDKNLKNAAHAIDYMLSNSPYQTVVHGDAKLANFCFSVDGSEVAAVDFQYVGGGCGMKDVAYFLGSCLDEEECQRRETELLDFYFEALQEAIKIKQKQLNPDHVEQAWRPLYPVAWTDFHRFIKGWSPGHWKINSYSESLAKQVVLQLQQG